jgi:hypothetical protein
MIMGIMLRIYCSSAGIIVQVCPIMETPIDQLG